MKKKNKNKRRTATYKDWITKEGLLKLEGWARDGLIDEQIAANIGIHPSTIYVWKKKYPEIDEALKKGKEVVDREVENALLKRALGYKYEEVKTEIGEDETKVTKTIKEVIPDTTAQIFWLKNRKSEMWRDKQDIDIKGDMEVNNPFKELTTEELKKLAEMDDTDD